MRVIAGEYRGRPLKALKGDATRPTTDRVKEALMSKVFSTQGSLENCCVLDAFAGTGALGIEALSRGASFVIFCDKSSEANMIISENLRAVKAENSRYQLLKMDSLSLSSSVIKKQIDLVFFDPPYAVSPHEVMAIAKGYFEKGILKEDALLCYELTKTSKPELVQAINALEWAIVSSKDYGETSIALIRKDTQ